MKSLPGNPFRPYSIKPDTMDGLYSEAEKGLANRNHGLLLETLECDVTPTGAHYLLNHFDVPIIDETTHRLTLSGAFDNREELTLEDIRQRPSVTMPVTLECAGNGRAGVSPRSHSMPWGYEAVGTSLWTGTPLAPLIEEAAPTDDTVEIAFIGADYGYDMGSGHFFGRSLTLEALRDLDVMLVYEMNGAPLLPQHGAPLRIIVPGWYGMASVKWLSQIIALTEPYDGYQQVGTYRFKKSPDDVGTPIRDIRVKSLMKPPGVPDWSSRKRLVRAGPTPIVGRAWSGLGRQITKVEVDTGTGWMQAELSPGASKYAWSKWTFTWDATPGAYTLRCRATDEDGNQQPLTPPWDEAGFANNAVQSVTVFVE
ncbi:MAG: sulfite oxidase [Pseudomonadota bacterium]